MHHQGQLGVHSLEVSLGGGRRSVGKSSNKYNRSKSHDATSSGLAPQRSSRKIHSGGNMLNLYSFNKKSPAVGAGMYRFLHHTPFLKSKTN